MADMYTMTPGSAVADTLQQIMEKRRATERQALLDALTVSQHRLNEENVRSQMGERAAESKRQETQLKIMQDAEGRQGRVANAQIAADEARRQGEQISQLPFGETPTEQIDPELVKVLQQRGLTKADEINTPKVTGFTGLPGFLPETGFGGMPIVTDVETTRTNERFVGQPDYQKKQEELGRIKQLMAKDTDPDRAAAYEALAGGAINQLSGNLFEPKPGIVTVSPEGIPGQRREYPRGTQFLELNYPPQSPASLVTPQTGIAPNPADGNKLWVYERVPGQAMNQARWLHPLADNQTSRNAVTRTPTNNAMLDRAMDDYGTIRRGANTGNRASALLSTEQRMITTMSVPPAVKNEIVTAVRGYREDSQKGAAPPLDKIANTIFRLYPTLSDPQKSEVMGVLNVILTEE